MQTHKYIVARIVKDRVVLQDYLDETLQVLVEKDSFAPVREGDVVAVTWTGPVGGPAYTVVLESETQQRP